MDFNTTETPTSVHIKNTLRTGVLYVTDHFILITSPTVTTFVWSSQLHVKCVKEKEQNHLYLHMQLYLDGSRSERVTETIHLWDFQVRSVYITLSLWKHVIRRL